MHRLSLTDSMHVTAQRLLSGPNHKVAAIPRYDEPDDPKESAPAYGPESMLGETDPRDVIPGE